MVRMRIQTISKFTSKSRNNQNDTASKNKTSEIITKKLDIRRLLLLILAPLLSTVLLGLITITFVSLFFRLGNWPFVFFVLMVMMRLLLLVRYKKDIKKGLTFSVRDPISVVFNFISFSIGRAFGGNWIQVGFPTQRIVTLGRPPSK